MVDSAVQRPLVDDEPRRSERAAAAALSGRSVS